MWLAVLVAVPAVAQPVRRPTWAERTRAMETPQVRRRILAVNVAGTAALVLGRSAVEGEVDDLADGAEALAWGAVAGAGFYAAKRISGEGQPALALGVAALAGSLAENVSTGGGVLGHLRVPLGVADLRVRTPFATRRDGPSWASRPPPSSSGRRWCSRSGASGRACAGAWPCSRPTTWAAAPVSAARAGPSSA